MKNVKKVIAASVVVIGTVHSSFAQSAATASSSAVIISPISLTKNVDMSFGNIAVAAGTGGTVVLAPGGTRTTGGAGGVTLPATSGTVSAANFTVSGNPDYTMPLLSLLQCR